MDAGVAQMLERVVKRGGAGLGQADTDDLHG